MKFKVGDKVITLHEIEHVIPARTKGVVKRVHLSTHSSFPYDVCFENHEKSFPMTEDEMEFYVPWYRRVWNRVALHNPVE